MFQDFESAAFASEMRFLPEALDLRTRRYGVRIDEVFKGTQIVAWHGAINRQLDNMIKTAESQNNAAYTAKLRKFQNLWQVHEPGGSINRETIDPLVAASDMLATDEWRMKQYFQSLNTSLKTLVASLDELPVAGTPPPMPGRSGGGGPPPADFGPEDGPGGGPDGGDQMGVGGGAGGGAPGMAGADTPPEAGAPEQAGPPPPGGAPNQGPNGAPNPDDENPPFPPR